METLRRSLDPRSSSSSVAIRLYFICLLLALAVGGVAIWASPFSITYRENNFTSKLEVSLEGLQTQLNTCEGNIEKHTKDYNSLQAELSLITREKQQLQDLLKQEQQSLQHCEAQKKIQDPQK